MKKKQTRPGNRKLKQEKQKGIELGIAKSEEKLQFIKDQLIAMFPEIRIAQVQDTLAAGMDVNITATFSAKKLMEILRS